MVVEFLALLSHAHGADVIAVTRSTVDRLAFAVVVDVVIHVTIAQLAGRSVLAESALLILTTVREGLALGSSRAVGAALSARGALEFLGQEVASGTRDTLDGVIIAFVLFIASAVGLREVFHTTPRIVFVNFIVDESALCANISVIRRAVGFLGHALESRRSVLVHITCAVAGVTQGSVSCLLASRGSFAFNTLALAVETKTGFALGANISGCACRAVFVLLGAWFTVTTLVVSIIPIITQATFSCFGISLASLAVLLITSDTLFVVVQEESLFTFETNGLILVGIALLTVFRIAKSTLTILSLKVLLLTSTAERAVVLHGVCLAVFNVALHALLVLLLEPSVLCVALFVETNIIGLADKAAFWAFGLVRLADVVDKRVSFEAFLAVGIVLHLLAVFNRHLFTDVVLQVISEAALDALVVVQHQAVVNDNSALFVGVKTKTKVTCQALEVVAFLSHVYAMRINGVDVDANVILLDRTVNALVAFSISIVNLAIIKSFRLASLVVFVVHVPGLASEALSVLDIGAVSCV